MSYPLYPKDVDAVLDWTFDWADPAVGSWLAVGETIVERVVTVEDGISKTSDAVTGEGTSVTVWLSGGTAGGQYDVACRITTDQGRTDERTITILVEQR